MKKHLYILCILCAFLVQIVPYSTFADSSGSIETDESGPDEASSTPDVPPQESFYIHIKVNYPAFPDSSSQSALKTGDRFSIGADSDLPFIHNVTADLHELNLSSETELTNDYGGLETEDLTLPSGVSDGRKAITVHALDAFGNDHSAEETVLVDSTPVNGTLQATFSNEGGQPGTWIAHIAGTYSDTGSGSIIAKGFTIGTNGTGITLSTSNVDVSSISISPSPFHADLPIPDPATPWSNISFGITLVDEAGNQTDVISPAFPLLQENAVLINHAVAGSLVTAPNYVPENAPAGIGIPHTLINSLPRGDYYAVVFFKDLVGCPSAYYAINSFRPSVYWGYDIIGPNQAFSKAYSTSGGGCMQEFHIDPARDGDWLWGALSTVGTSTAIADTNGIPAFAICATEEACDPISPQSEIMPKDPVTDTLSPSGVSNVLFLPGIKGSELYEQNSVCEIPLSICDIPLWLPLTDLSVPELFMNEDGTSKHHVYAKEGAILSHAYSQSFYDAFVQNMEQFKTASSGEGWNWKPVAYDWRMSLPDIANNGSEQGPRIYFEDATDTPYILQDLRELASTSPTGKVTIIAHSNGGLVAKELMRKLGDTETAQLIDTVIFVGVPQSGAPRALTSLLFGEGESLPATGILSGLLMSANHARTFGLHAPMAYHLLPSAAYFAETQGSHHPLISFGDGILLSSVRSLFGSGITSFENFRRYALGGDGRTAPPEEDLEHPAVLNEKLFTYATNVHSDLDSWQPPPGVSMYQIAGSGNDTISGVEFYQQEVEGAGGTSSQILYRPEFAEDGDGTVPVSSALMMGENDHIHRYWINLPSVSNNHQWFSHANLFEIPEVEELISNILHKDTDVPSDISTNPLEAQGTQKKLLFILHSPATLSVVDSEEREASVTYAGVQKNEIPESEGGNIGTVNYVLVPAGSTYQVRMDSLQSDSLVFDVQELENGTIVASSTTSMIVSDPSSSISFTIKDGIADASPLDIRTKETESKSVPVAGSKKEISTSETQEITQSASPVIQPAATSSATQKEMARPQPLPRTYKPKAFSFASSETNQALHTEKGDLTTSRPRNFWTFVVTLLKSIWREYKELFSLE